MRKGSECISGENFSFLLLSRTMIQSSDNAHVTQLIILQFVSDLFSVLKKKKEKKENAD